MILFLVGLLCGTAFGARLDGVDHHDHHHDHDHEHHDFPLATGNEARIASGRLLEFFTAVEEELPWPGDMPSYNELPTNIQFTCDNKISGYYADVDYGCQVYHMCRDDPEHSVASFLCPNATIFHQAIFACDWWFNVDCASSPSYFHLNEDLYKEPEEEEGTGNFQETFGDFVRFVRSALLPPPTQEFVIVTPEGADSAKASRNAVDKDYVPPLKGGYLLPDPGYIPPKGGYLPPDPGYLPPKTDYLPPDDGYLPPKKGYLPPTEEYLPPKN